ncbi:MAG: TonB-dependent receptor, partial [Bacteroidota bacterium]
PQVRVDLLGDETPRSLLTNLQQNQIINFKIADPLILISEYVLKKYTINGTIKDTKNGESLIGASIQLNNSTLGTITNGYGYYSLTVPEGSYAVHVSHVGFRKFETQIDLRQNINLNVSMAPSVTKLEEVQINSISSNVNISSSVPSVTRIKINDKGDQIPYLLGAVDLIQNAFLHPGISTTGEDANGFHVRGGRVDQNLILLDEATIYNPNHYIQVSIFNPEAVNDVKILKGFIPPSYGGRASSVVEVRQKEGNTKKMSYSGGIGPFSARALVEGPFRKGKSSFLASVRQSLLNLDVNDFASTSVRRDRFSFTDVNLKINSKPNKYNSYYLSGYFGNDRNAFGLNSLSNWGNRMVNFRWNHVFSPRIFSNLSSYVSEYSYRNESFDEPGSFVSRSRIVDYSVKSDITYSFNPKNNLNFGFSSIFHRLKPGDREPFIFSTVDINTIRLDTEHGLESGTYLNHELELGRFSFNYGLRYSLFHSFGPDDVRVYEAGLPFSDSTIIDTVSFSKREVIKFYNHAEPRLSLNWRLLDHTSLKASYSKM